ncbi:hypothetical protein PIROE2DRAFT_61406 [Piromyces sp. E2]|nr:hypothetical protein PIROE2DRAFT_61406 [Piromyces sp. E2]|eukprot:OUM63245.1 hypothetical protein PIROE2DRAFT_61406 [Piromyces sp. E2]
MRDNNNLEEYILYLDNIDDNDDVNSDGTFSVTSSSTCFSNNSNDSTLINTFYQKSFNIPKFFEKLRDEEKDMKLIILCDNDVDYITLQLQPTPSQNNNENISFKCEYIFESNIQNNNNNNNNNNQILSFRDTKVYDSKDKQTEIYKIKKSKLSPLENIGDVITINVHITIINEIEVDDENYTIETRIINESQSLLERVGKRFILSENFYEFSFNLSEIEDDNFSTYFEIQDDESVTPNPLKLSKLCKIIGFKKFISISSLNEKLPKSDDNIFVGVFIRVYNGSEKEKEKEEVYNDVDKEVIGECFIEYPIPYINNFTDSHYAEFYNYNNNKKYKLSIELEVENNEIKIDLGFDDNNNQEEYIVITSIHSYGDYSFYYNYSDRDKNDYEKYEIREGFDGYKVHKDPKFENNNEQKIIQKGNVIRLIKKLENEWILGSYKDEDDENNPTIDVVFPERYIESNCEAKEINNK